MVVKSSITHPLQHLHNERELLTPKFKYIESRHAVAWVDGGSIPIHSVRRFQAGVRDGMHTPDEVMQRKLEGLSESQIGNYVTAKATSRAILRIHGGVYEGGVKVGENVTFEQVPDDGIVLCLARRNHRPILDHLKKSDPTCIEVLDPLRLYALICEQLGQEGLVANCSYTSTILRNHFLKSKLDEVLEEFRMFWPLADTAWVQLPPGIGRIVALPV